MGAPLNDTVELAGPEAFRLDELAQRLLSARDDPRQVTADVHARYFGAKLEDRSLTPATTHASPRPASRTGSASQPPSPDPNREESRMSPRRPTIVLIHGAFAESSSWDAVIDRLLAIAVLRAALHSA